MQQHEATPDSVSDLLRMSGEAFIRACYRSILGREADAEGLRHYREALRAGKSKESILVDIAVSPDAKQRGIDLEGLKEMVASHRARASFWRGWWHRLGDLARSVYRSEALINEISSSQAQLLAHLEAIAALANQHHRSVGIECVRLINALIDLEDDEFVRTCYREFLGREADPGGFEHHFKHLQAGRPRAQVLVDFATSTEARNRIKNDRPAAMPATPTVMAAEALSPRARQIYADLKSALAQRQQEVH